MLEDARGELAAKIDELRVKRNAIVLVHNYQLGEVQDIGDLVGDSLDLSRKAADADADVIVFCGVHFMAETAAILAPKKTVLLPALEAGCPMADMIDAEGLKDLKEKHPDAAVVCYVNSTADVKALSDVCCTSANAPQVVASIPESQPIIFVPDQFLGHFVRQQTGREIHLAPGFCPTHVRILPDHILRKKKDYPQAEVLAHPECRPEVTELADHVLSTGGMIRRAGESEADTLIIATEMGILHRLQGENPEKNFVPATEQAICPNMKLTTLESVLWSLETMQNEISVEEATRVRAEKAVRRMIETTG
ncbi:MAG: quinolinate synthase NadA [Planctomycetota bacterium]|jgi:quinolinate synthase